MTTIVYDGFSLVGDRKMTYNSQRFVETTKVFRLENNDCFQAIGFSGNPEVIYRVIEKLENNEYDFEWEKDDFTAIVVDHLGDCWIIEASGDATEVDVPWAIGSGALAAHGAMLAGANAKTALNIAEQLDVMTGLGTDEIEIIA